MTETHILTLTEILPTILLAVASAALGGWLEYRRAITIGQINATFEDFHRQLVEMRRDHAEHSSRLAKLEQGRS